jgi:acyl transferase domain-containing protein
MVKRIAIIGCAFELPGNASSSERLWEILTSDEDVFIPFPRSRLNIDDPIIAAALTSKRAPLIANVEHFDHALFRMSKKEADAISPLQKKNLTISFRALENSRVTPSSLGRKTGVFVVDCYDEFPQTIRSDISNANAFHNLNVSSATFSGRISNAFGFTGPSATISTACSSSIYALNAAILALQSEQCNAAIVSGVNMIYGSLKSILHAKSSMISPSGRCHSFKAEADGYVRGEAAVAIVLKDLERAIQDGDEILSVIDSVYVNHNGFSSSMKEPQVAGEEECFRQAVLRSGIANDSVEVVEAHGTGTIVGDRIEVEAIRRVLNHELALTAVKSQLGHAEGTSGLVSIVKVIECLRRGLIAPIYRYREPPQEYDLGNLRPVKNTMVWSSPKRHALICNYGFSGTNGAVVMSNE